MRTRRRVLTRSLIFVLLFFATACTSIRPIEKIGLVAPFEGLYRQTGYGALAAVRAAIGEAVRGDVDLLPLALDGHYDAERTRRSVAKVMADDRVGGLVGPLHPQMVAAVDDLFDDDFTWVVPYVIDPDGGFSDPRQSTDWAYGLLAAVGAAADEQGALRLALAGAEDGWPALTDEAWSEVAGIPVVRVDSPGEVEQDDAIFWLGDSANGADFLNQLRVIHPDVPFWLGLGGDDPVFAQRATGIEKVYWATWTDLEYTSWAANRSQALPTHYLITLATNTVIGSINGEDSKPQPSGGRNWFVQLYTIGKDGVLIARS